MRLFVYLSLACAFLLVACSAQVRGTQTSVQSPSPPLATGTRQPVIAPTIRFTPTILQTLSCEEWQSWPVIPQLGETARQLYQRGQASGNNSRAFSKIGDGEISTEWFFTAFDVGESYYDLGPYQELRPVIDQFEGSFGRMSMAARRGFNAQRILDPSRSDPSLCETGESPLTCELRLQRPGFAILSLGTNQIWQPEEFESGMRQILEILLSHNVVPILSTKGDNLEGDQRINHTIACLAQEHDVPLWNFWAAIQPLPNHGLQPDLEHLTYGKTDFDNPNAMQTAWTLRNLTALQVLDTVWRGVRQAP